MTQDDLTDAAKDIARDTGDHPVVRAAARTGYVANGLVHLLIGWAALGIAWTPLQHGTADQSGALAQLAQQPWGKPLLVVLVVGFAGLGMWQLAEAVGGWHGRGTSAWFSRGKAVSKAVAYAVLGWTTLAVVRGTGTTSRSQTAQATQTLLSAPAGRILVGLVGVVILAIGGYHVVKGAQRKFLADLVENPGELAEQAGRYGYIAKGVALGVVGLLFLAAAATADPSRSTGLDGALRALSDTPMGTGLLTLVALGLAAFGIYSFFRARYTKV